MGVKPERRSIRPKPSAISWLWNGNDADAVLIALVCVAEVALACAIKLAHRSHVNHGLEPHEAARLWWMAGIIAASTMIGLIVNRCRPPRVGQHFLLTSSVFLIVAGIGTMLLTTIMSVGVGV